MVGATGAQGGATLRALRRRGFPVRALVRDPDTDSAQALVQLGAELRVGDLNEQESLLEAMTGVTGVFSIQQPDPGTNDLERRQGFALVDAAIQTGVQHFVHTSVCEAGRHESFPLWNEGVWSRKYWTDKWDVEEKVRNAGFECWTVLRPAFMMDNFIRPKAKYMFRSLSDGLLETAFGRDSKLQLIASEDVGEFAAAAFADPAKFNRQNIDLACAALSIDEVTNQLNEMLGTSIEAVYLTYEEAVETGIHEGLALSQKWVDFTGGYKADLDAVRSWGIELTDFRSWTVQHKNDFRIPDVNGV